MSTFRVTHKAMRPASDQEKCFYCHEPTGGFHADDCVLIQKRVKVRMTVEYEIKVPAHWEKWRIENHRNESSWCQDNAIQDLEELAKEECLCGLLNYNVVDMGDGSVWFDE